MMWVCAEHSPKIGLTQVPTKKQDATIEAGKEEENAKHVSSIPAACLLPAALRAGACRAHLNSEALEREKGARRQEGRVWK